MSNLRGEKVSLRPINPTTYPKSYCGAAMRKSAGLQMETTPKALQRGGMAEDIAGDRYRKYFGIIFENQLIGDIELIISLGGAEMQNSDPHRT